MSSVKPEPILTIRLGKPPPSGNKLMKSHWRILQGYRTKWRDKMATALMVARSRSSKDLPVQDSTERWLLVAHWVSKRPPTDTHPNCCIAIKPIVDAIAGDRSIERILWDDDDAHLDIKIIPRKALKGEAEELRFDFYRMKQEGSLFEQLREG